MKSQRRSDDPKHSKVRAGVTPFLDPPVRCLLSTCRGLSLTNDVVSVLGGGNTAVDQTSTDRVLMELTYLLDRAEKHQTCQ